MNRDFFDLAVVHQLSGEILRVVEVVAGRGLTSLLNSLSMSYLELVTLRKSNLKDLGSADCSVLNFVKAKYIP